MPRPLQTLRLIEKQSRTFKIPSVTLVSLKDNPYLVLVSCILSLRTKDETTISASRRLFKIADSPRKMLKIARRKLEQTIYPVGFYRNKARVILEASKKILSDFSGKVPDNLEELLEIRGVGRKTANLVLGLGYHIPAICVDTHVHRISNRLGWVNTREPQETEERLRRIFAQRYWIRLNDILVSFGQNICLPVSPLCSKCSVYKSCPRRSVGRHR